MACQAVDMWNSKSRQVQWNKNDPIWTQEKRAQREIYKESCGVNQRPDDKIFVNQVNMCFVSKRVDHNCALVKFLWLQCGEWTGCDRIQPCNRNIGKKGIIASIEMIAIVEIGRNYTWEILRGKKRVGLVTD